MSKVLITGSSGLVGSESVRFFSDKFDHIIGIDNNLREYFFGSDASTVWNLELLKEHYDNFSHYDLDIRSEKDIEKIFYENNSDISLIIHAAAQPSHDWAANEPKTDFSINANGTLNLLELMRKFCPKATFIFLSTNKVYGDKVNQLPFIELEHRWEINKDHEFYEKGINENFSIDQSTHSLFGVSKLAADVLVQEYGKYFSLNTGVFRAGCITGASHSGTKLHGFLSYLVRCAHERKDYTIFGYKGKQVRDNIHSNDLINMFWQFFNNPKMGEVYNVGGGTFSNCSIIEAISIIEELSGIKMKFIISGENRKGDHKWWISNLEKYKSHFPDWTHSYDIKLIIKELIERYSQY